MGSRKIDRTFLTYLELFSAMVFWGLSFVATKVALESFPVFTLIFVRLSLGACLFLIYFLRVGFPRFSRQDHMSLFLIALFEPGLYFVFETMGLQYTTAPKASLIIATIPMAVLVLAYFFLRERSTPAGFLGIVISLLGIGVLTAGDSQFRLEFSGQFLGDLLIFGAVLSASLYTIRVRALAQRRSALDITSMQTIYGALFYAPAFLWEMPSIVWSTISGRSIGAVVYLVLFATIGAFLCYNHALSKVSASRAAVFINGVPVVTALAAWGVLGETLTGIQGMGGGLVLLGVFITNYTGKRVSEKRP